MRPERKDGCGDLSLAMLGRILHSLPAFPGQERAKMMGGWAGERGIRGGFWTPGKTRASGPRGWLSLSWGVPGGRRPDRRLSGTCYGEAGVNPHWRGGGYPREATTEFSPIPK